MCVGPKGWPKGKTDPKSALTLTLLLTLRICPYCSKSCNRHSTRVCFPVSDKFAQSSFYSTSVPLFSSPKSLPRAVAFRGWCRSTVLVYSRALAQAKALVLSEAPSRSGERRSPKRARVRALACCSCFSPSEEPHLWARGCLAQARRARLSEPCESLPASLSRSRLSESPPPKRGHSSRLSEGS
ncbi:hypothetical protein DEO72_LG10g2858 [Vigna unguiculata]|uniref:Uncharacterized protein n=1 Tax=Vigna unguiculata TaxID=3917 RepID=A0A4D6NCQ9_VIGUN|nr:hypothetical protein DEO72_LG10g2858 [Vigna unguiculata]